MRTRCSRLMPLLLVAVIPACVGGPDPIRLQAEKRSHALAQRCADGWFQGLAWVPQDRELVQKSLDDWKRRLESDERLLAAPLGGAK